jgi:hypothetical protein
VTGDAIGQDVLATVAGLPPDRFSDAVAEAVAAGILWRRPSEHPACGFLHALLREAAYAEIDAEVRRGLHLELAAALEALPARPGRLAEIAHHPSGGGAGRRPTGHGRSDGGGRGRSLAGVRPRDRGRAVHGRPGRDWTVRLGGAARGWRARLLSVLGSAQQHAGDPTRARQTLLEAYALASDAGKLVLAADAAVRMPRLIQWAVPDRELEAVLTGALKGLGDAAPALAVRLLARRAVIAVAGPHFDCCRPRCLRPTSKGATLVFGSSYRRPGRSVCQSKLALRP